MRHGFQNTTGLGNRTFDGRNCIIEDRLYAIDRLGNKYRTKSFLRTDGGSIPPLGTIGGVLMFLTMLLTRWSAWFYLLAIPCLLVCIAGLYLTSYAIWWWSYVFHDACYQGQVERFNPHTNEWEDFMPSEALSNALLAEFMGTQKAQWWEYSVVWIALKWFGWRAFSQDRKRAASRFGGAGKKDSSK